MCPYSTPCVGGTMENSEEGRWLTYEELAKELGSTLQAARILAVRRKYPRRIPNSYGERTKVLVPEKIEISRKRKGHVGDTVSATDADNPAAVSQDQMRLVRAIETLTHQLRAANERADKADKRADEERQMRLDAERKIDAIR